MFLNITKIKKPEYKSFEFSKTCKEKVSTFLNFFEFFLSIIEKQVP